MTEAESDLRDDPQSFSFFQAVRLLRRLHPEARGIGEFANPEDEVVRLSVNPSLAFAAGEVQDLDPIPGHPDRLLVNFMGLVGNQGVLPTQYSLLVNDELKAEQRPLTDFLDIFQHRFLSLFYAAMERRRFYVPFERGDADRVSRHLFDFLGLGSEPLRQRMELRDEAFLFYCGLLAMRQRGSSALEQMLEDYFEVPIEVHQFVGGWYGLSEDSRCRVDDSQLEDRFEPIEGMGLGEGAAVGNEIWDPQARVRIRIGPMSRDRYDDFLPGGRAHRALQAITRFYSDDQFDFEVQLVLQGNDVPGVELGGSADEGAQPLGWCTWIRTRPFERDADETTLSL